MERPSADRVKLMAWMVIKPAEEGGIRMEGRFGGFWAVKWYSPVHGELKLVLQPNCDLEVLDRWGQRIDRVKGFRADGTEERGLWFTPESAGRVAKELGDQLQRRPHAAASTTDDAWPGVDLHVWGTL